MKFKNKSTCCISPFQNDSNNNKKNNHHVPALVVIETVCVETNQTTSASANTSL